MRKVAPSTFCIATTKVGEGMSARGSSRDFVASRHLGRGQRNDPETGATLLLALVFLVVVSLLAVTLVRVAGNNLLQSVQFKSAQINQSATNSVTNVALYQTRYNFPAYLQNNTAPYPCWTTAALLGSTTSPSSSSLTFPLNSGIGVTVSAWCTMTFDPTVAFDRVVSIYSCPIGISADACKANPMTLAIAMFSDFPTDLTATNCVAGEGRQTLGTDSTCGITMKLTSWIDRSTLS